MRCSPETPGSGARRNDVPAAHLPRRSGSAPPLEPGGLGLRRASALAIGVGTVTVLPGFLVGVLSLQIRSDLDVSLGRGSGRHERFFAAGALGTGLLGRLSQRAGALASMRTRPAAAARACSPSPRSPPRCRFCSALLVVAGLANAAHQPAINLFMAEEVPLGRQGLAFGVKQSAIPAAILVSGLALPALALPFGWRPTVAACGGMALAMAAVATAAGRSEPEATPRPQEVGPQGRARRERSSCWPWGPRWPPSAPTPSAHTWWPQRWTPGSRRGRRACWWRWAAAPAWPCVCAVGERADRRSDYGLVRWRCCWARVAGLRADGLRPAPLLLIGAAGGLQPGLGLARACSTSPWWTATGHPLRPPGSRRPASTSAPREDPRGLRPAGGPQGYRPAWAVSRPTVAGTAVMAVSSPRPSSAGQRPDRAAPGDWP